MAVLERTSLFELSLVSSAALWEGFLGGSSVGLLSAGRGVCVAGTWFGAVSSLLGFGLTRFRGLAGAMEMCA